MAWDVPATASISSGSGMDLSAPFLVVTMEAAAEAIVSISLTPSRSRESTGWTSRKFRQHPQKVSPAPVVSMVLSVRKASAFRNSSPQYAVLPSAPAVTRISGIP